MRQLLELLELRSTAAIDGVRRANGIEELVRWQSVLNETMNTIDLIEKPQPTAPTRSTGEN